MFRLQLRGVVTPCYGDENEVSQLPYEVDDKSVTTPTQSEPLYYANPKLVPSTNTCFST